MVSQRVRHDWVPESVRVHAHTHTRGNLAHLTVELGHSLSPAFELKFTSLVVLDRRHFLSDKTYTTSLSGYPACQLQNLGHLSIHNHVNQLLMINFSISTYISVSCRFQSSRAASILSSTSLNLNLLQQHMSCSICLSLIFQRKKRKLYIITWGRKSTCLGISVLWRFQCSDLDARKRWVQTPTCLWLCGLWQVALPPSCTSVLS